MIWDRLPGSPECSLYVRGPVRDEVVPAEAAEGKRVFDALEGDGRFAGEVLENIFGKFRMDDEGASLVGGRAGVGDYVVQRSAFQDPSLNGPGRASVAGSDQPAHVELGPGLVG